MIEGAISVLARKRRSRTCFSQARIRNESRYATMGIPAQKYGLESSTAYLLLWRHSETRQTWWRISWFGKRDWFYAEHDCALRMQKKSKTWRISLIGILKRRCLKLLWWKLCFAWWTCRRAESRMSIATREKRGGRDRWEQTKNGIRSFLSGNMTRWHWRATLRNSTIKVLGWGRTRQPRGSNVDFVGEVE